MDKAIVLGIYDFVSFHLGSTLLNKGFEVIGIHLERNDPIPFLEEKRLEVGRNANFREISLCGLDAYRDVDDNKTTLFLSLYDLYMLKSEPILQEQAVLKSLQQYLAPNKNLTDIVFLLPIQMLRTNEGQILEKVINQVIEWGKRNRFFYLPTIYGPWQPHSFLFQQALLAKFDESKIQVGEREWTGDTLFVEDAVEIILSSMESQNVVSNTKFLIESGIKDYWNQCVEQLQLEDRIKEIKESNRLDIDKSITRVKPKNLTPFTEAINKQLDYLDRYI
ncbi:hypothetical protein [Neobacillus cucumis]|uniref:hypothetical protein n=1 Tax=Neobacillus cucumis TaxID=1740721 RepID=UPI0019669F31|nr:hypothetical protein [Neobacillus cucumis]MBM7653701.1 nucleoside-diphosphate-sugar epimerase [Neobacillus cucumis]